MATESSRIAFGALLLALGACGFNPQADLPSNDSAGTGATTGSGGGLNLDPGGNAAGSSSMIPPEKEVDQSFRAPVATGKILWTANPDSGRVALIDAATLAVRITNAGFAPTYLAAVPTSDGSNSAIVINTGSHDATWLRATDTEIDATTIGTHDDANAWAISDDGHYAIAWTNAAAIDGGPPDAVNGYSEITVIDLQSSPPVATRLSVGFRPSKIAFDAKKQHAYAVVDEGITVVDLGKKPALDALIPVGSGSLTAHARDVNIAPAGDFALVRVDGSPDIEILDLASATAKTLTLEAPVTDLDLSADGKSATAVLGGEAKVAVFDVPNPAADTSTLYSSVIAGETVRSVTLTPDNQVALLYANGIADSHLSLLNLSSGSLRFGVRTVELQGAIQGVFAAPSSGAAITFQTPPANSMKRGLFGVVPTETVRSPKIVGTDATPTDVAFAPASIGKALVTVHDQTSSVQGVYLVGLDNLQDDFIALSSAPLPGATGIVPDAKRGFVAQKHPEGRITFIDLDTGAAHTITGFELAARVTY